MCFWILVIFLLLMVIGTAPAWPHSRRWGYFPSGGVTFLLVVLVVLWFASALPWWNAYPYWWGD